MTTWKTTKTRTTGRNEAGEVTALIFHPNKSDPVYRATAPLYRDGKHVGGRCYGTHTTLEAAKAAMGA